MVRRARRVEDRRRVIGCDLDGRPRRGTGEQRRERDDPAAEWAITLAVVEACADHRDAFEHRVVSVETLEALAVGEEHGRFAIGDAEGEFVPVPERVDRDRDRAGVGRGEERDRPLGDVAHRDRDTVALPDAEVLHERPGHLERTVPVLAVREALVAQHEEVAIRIERRPAVEQRAQIVRRVAPDLGGATRDLDDVDLESLTGCGQHAIDGEDVHAVRVQHCCMVCPDREPQAIALAEATRLSC